MKHSILFAFCALISLFANSQLPPLPRLPFDLPSSQDTVKKEQDTVARPARRTRMRPYSSIITRDAVTHRGLFTVHEVRDSILFEIPDSILHQDLMVISRLSQGPGGVGFYAGEELDEKTIQFEVGADSTVRIRYDLVISEADSNSSIYKAVRKSNLNPVVASFPIKAYGPGHKSYVIDVTTFLKSNSFVNSLGKNKLSQSVNAASMKDFNIEFIHAYPINVEISISKNLMTVASLSAVASPASLISNISFVGLPRVPMQRRLFDPRVGYFADLAYIFGDEQQRSEERRFIQRWRLEPRKEDREKWKRGELVEPEKPIVFYIDPATPKQWRKYLVLGINDWQKAFEQAGFRNAIIGKEWPENDSAMNVDDARYSFIRYLPSTIENAYGPNVHDPRSGEIIQSHIGWYHNVMELLHSWYMIQAGAVDPRARHPKFDEELMGQLIRFVSSHEVGHTLGLRHNFGSSSRTPVEKLRDKAWLDVHGHTASIMDYARFNYVAQPEDNIPEEDLFPHIGEYDKWAIQWGYRNSGASSAEEDKKVAAGWIADSLARNPRLWFGSGETEKFDPRCQTEDLGDNAMKANTYGIKNLKRILPLLPAWTHEQDGLYDNLEEMYTALTQQYFRYMGQVLKNIGGVYHTIRREGEPGNVYEPAPAAMQQEALAFFNTQLFTTPYWLLDTTVLNKIHKPAQPDFVEDLQVKVLNSLLDTGRLNLLLANTRQFGVQKAYPVEEYLSTIHRYIWRELSSARPMDSYRRNLQKAYVGALMETMLSPKPEYTETDSYSIIRADLITLQKEIGQALPHVTGKLDRYHLQDMEARIKKGLNATRQF